MPSTPCLRAERHHGRIAARGGRDRRLDRRQRGHHDQRLPRPVRHGVSGRGRGDRFAGRSPQSRRLDHLLGCQPGGEPPAALHSLQPDAQGHVPARRPQGPHLRADRRPQDQVGTHGGPCSSRSSREAISSPVGSAGFGPRASSLDPRAGRREDRPAAVGLAGFDGSDESGQVRRDLLRHGSDHDPRQARQHRSAAGADARYEQVHAFRLPRRTADTATCRARTTS